MRLGIRANFRNVHQRQWAFRAPTQFHPNRSWNYSTKREPLLGGRDLDALERQGQIYVSLDVTQLAFRKQTYSNCLLHHLVPLIQLIPHPLTSWVCLLAAMRHSRQQALMFPFYQHFLINFFVRVYLNEFDSRFH